MYFVSLQKINAKNAFGLHLIDYMADMLHEQGGLTNFQVSCYVFSFLYFGSLLSCNCSRLVLSVGDKQRSKLEALCLNAQS